MFKTTVKLFVFSIMVQLCNTAMAQSYPLLQPGDLAPDFQLKLLDGTLDRSLHEVQRPTVLFFGSYS